MPGKLFQKPDRHGDRLLACRQNLAQLLLGFLQLGFLLLARG
jgi:hypothetical protein